jgi:hypothetical protein
MLEGAQPDFSDRCLVSCGMLHREITHLAATGFLNSRQVYFTPPGLHALPVRLEDALLDKLSQAKRRCPDDKIVVVYGKKCYVNADDPGRRVDAILQEVSPEVVRVQGEYGYDMLASYEDRQRISDGRQDKILWFTPGWLRSWKAVYQNYFGWDRADANANFPGYYDKIVVLDGLGYADTYMSDHAEDILELFDWTGLVVEFQPITLDRFTGLLQDALIPPKNEGGDGW